MAGLDVRREGIHKRQKQKELTSPLSHANGTGNIGATITGSQKLPCLPVTQQIPPSRFVMALVSSCEGARGCVPEVTTSDRVSERRFLKRRVNTNLNQ